MDEGCDGQGFWTERHWSCYFDGGREYPNDPVAVGDFRCCACGAKGEIHGPILVENGFRT